MLDINHHYIIYNWGIAATYCFNTPEFNSRVLLYKTQLSMTRLCNLLQICSFISMVDNYSKVTIIITMITNSNDGCDSYDYHWDFYGHSLVFELHFSLTVTKYFWYSKCTTPWMFQPLDILFTIGLNMPCLHSLLGYSTWEFYAFQLIVLVVYIAVD